MTNYLLKFKWTTSKGRNTYGWNICTLYVNETKVAQCNGGGYDMKGTNLGNWIAHQFKKELMQLNKPHIGLTYHNPNYNPKKAKLKHSDGIFTKTKDIGKTYEQLEKEGKVVNLQIYREFYQASNKTPTKQHTIPLIDGACGFNSISRILNEIGYTIEYTSETKNTTTYHVYKKEN